MKLSNCHSGLLTGAPGPLKVAKPVREYDWGSTGALATLEGREPSGRPEAEWWWRHCCYGCTGSSRDSRYTCLTGFRTPVYPA